MREIWPVPFRLWRVETADLPAAADYEGGWLYDITSSLPKYSNGTSWIASEPAISAGTTTQYWRGDKTWQTLNGAAVINVPAGAISSTTVQGALNELDTEKLAVSVYTESDILTKIKTVDGAGSGLDADLLDGQDGAYYLARANHTGTQLAATISNFSAAADARIAAAVGVSVQAYDAQLAAIAGLTPAVDQTIYWTSATTAAMTGFTSAARTLVAQTTQALMRSTGLGLGTAATQNTGTSGTAVPLLDGATTTWTNGSRWGGGVAAVDLAAPTETGGQLTYSSAAGSSFSSIGAANALKPFNYAASIIRFFTGTLSTAATLRFSVTADGVDGTGSSGAGTRAITASTTAAASDYTIRADATGGAIVLALPAANTATRRIYNVKKIDATVNAVTIDPSGAELIDGAATRAITTQYTNVTVQSNGTGWDIL